MQRGDTPFGSGDAAVGGPSATMKTVETVRDVLEVVQAAMFTLLGVVAFWRWFTRRGAARAWLAATFGALAMVTLLGLVLPDDGEQTDTVDAATRVTVVLIALFPYLLFRFGATFRRRHRLTELVALAVTVAVIGGVFAFPSFPAENETWSPGFTAWALLLLAQWVALSAVVAAELWRAGRGQPTVSRRRMRILSVASLGLAFALVFTAGAGESDVGFLVTQALALGAAPLFLVGFAPPQFVLAAWRRPELEDLRAAEEVLLQAQSPVEVGHRLLPHVTRIIGGGGAALFDGNGELLGVHGMAEDEARQMFAAAHEGGAAEVITLPVRAGRLVVRVSPYTPYFGRSETELLTRLATFTDLALSRAELSERERQTARELQAANEAMREFVAIASHDLRTPVTVIKGFASTLEQDWEHVPDEQRSQYLAAVRRHADHLGVIIDDLLTTSRLDAGVLEPSPADVELRPFLEALAADLRAEAPADLEVPDGVAVRVDPEHLRRIVTNYLVNAFRYGAPPVTVRVTATAGRKEVEIVVCDEGEGVPDEFQPRVFEKFARVDKRNSRANQGTGLGLAIVRGLARAAGGDAWYRPNSPTGACFGVRLPAAGSAAVSAER